MLRTLALLLMHPILGPVGLLSAGTLNLKMAEYVSVSRPLHNVDSLSILLFYNITNFELVNSILFRSKMFIIINLVTTYNTFHDVLTA